MHKMILHYIMHYPSKCGHKSKKFTLLLSHILFLFYKLNKQEFMFPQFGIIYVDTSRLWALYAEEKSYMDYTIHSNGLIISTLVRTYCSP